MVQQGLDWAVAIVCRCYIMETVCKTKSKKNKSVDKSNSNAKAKSQLILIIKEKTVQKSGFIITLKKETKLSSYKFLWYY